MLGALSALLGVDQFRLEPNDLINQAVGVPVNAVDALIRFARDQLDFRGGLGLGLLGPFSGLDHLGLKPREGPLDFRLRPSEAFVALGLRARDALDRFLPDLPDPRIRLNARLLRN